MLYNNPSRTASNIGFETLKKLSNIKNIVALKECSGDLSVFTRWRLELNEEFSIFSGNDDTACGAMACGANGIISVGANVLPELFVRVCNAAKNKDWEKFAILRDVLAPLHDLMFTEPSPAPVKYALSKLGLISNELRLPLGQISDSLREKIDGFMEKMKIG
jgi:4-hydroxy-tetrahydrodipicolinate synthase